MTAKPRLLDLFCGAGARAGDNAAGRESANVLPDRQRTQASLHVRPRGRAAVGVQGKEVIP